jgi:hypothetical protein
VGALMRGTNHEGRRIDRPAAPAGPLTEMTEKRSSPSAEVPSQRARRVRGIRQSAAEAQSGRRRPRALHCERRAGEPRRRPPMGAYCRRGHRAGGRGRGSDPYLEAWLSRGRGELAKAVEGRDSAVRYCRQRPRLLLSTRCRDRGRGGTDRSWVGGSETRSLRRAWARREGSSRAAASRGARWFVADRGFRAREVRQVTNAARSGSFGAAQRVAATTIEPEIARHAGPRWPPARAPRGPVRVVAR